ncbi:MAG TPA: type VII secretion target [Mycobacterium sp.]|nr:type VII secretion target [Mycobacterium sp.]
MEQRHVSVDPAAICAVANRFDASAEIIDHAARTQLARLAFGGASAGRVHAAGGDAVRRALGRWDAELARWSRAGAEIAGALRASARRYADAELRAADRVG